MPRARAASFPSMGTSSTTAIAPSGVAATRYTNGVDCAWSAECHACTSACAGSALTQRSRRKRGARAKDAARTVEQQLIDREAVHSLILTGGGSHVTQMQAPQASSVAQQRGGGTPARALQASSLGGKCRLR